MPVAGEGQRREENALHPACASSTNASTAKIPGYEIWADCTEAANPNGSRKPRYANE